MDERVKILGRYYPVEDLLAQNDVEPWVVVQFLVDEELINLNDYFYEDELIDD